MKNLVARILLILFATGLFVSSCVEDNFDFDKLSDQVELRPTYVVPIASGTLTLANALNKEDENIDWGSDNLVRLIFREDSVIYITASELLEIPQQSPVSKLFNLGPILLDDFDQSRSILLDELKDNMDPALQTFFETNDGQNEIFPAIGPVSMGSYTASLIEDFEYVYFTTGDLEVSLTNRLPVTVTVTAEIRNNSDNSLVGSATFSNLGPGATNTQIVDLSGVYVESVLDFTLSSFQTPGSSSSQVLIDLQDDLLVFVEGKNLSVDRGRAIIPDQVIEAEAEYVDLELDENEELYKIILAQARIDYEVSSAVSDGLYLSFVLPETRRNNQVVEYYLEIQQGGGPTTGSIDLAGTETDLTTDPLQAFNRLPVNYEVGIKSSGQMVTFDLTGDDVSFTYSVEDVDFYYVEGWLGQKVVDVEDEEFDFSEDIDDFYEKFSGEIRLTNPMVRLAYENSFGVPVRLNFNMTGYGDEGETVVLNPPVIDFLAPSDTLQPAFEGSAEVNRDNSGIVDLIALPPQRIDFSGSANANPGGTPATNFVKNTSYFLANLEVDIPLELQINNLEFTDTIPLPLFFRNIRVLKSSESDPGDENYVLDKLVNGYLDFTVENGFPLDLRFDFIFWDNVKDTLLHEFNDIVIMEPAPVNAEGIVPAGQKTVSTGEIDLTTEVIEKIKKANQVIVRARLSTSEGGTSPVKILSTYEIGFQARVRSSLVIN